MLMTKKWDEFSFFTCNTFSLKLFKFQITCGKKFNFNLYIVSLNNKAKDRVLSLYVLKERHNFFLYFSWNMLYNKFFH